MRARNSHGAIDWGERNFMAQPPRIRQKGDVWAVSQDYLLSPSGGWPEGVYEFVER